MKKAITNSQNETIKLTKETLFNEQQFMNEIIHDNNKKYEYIFKKDHMNTTQNNHAVEVKLIDDSKSLKRWNITGQSRINKQIAITLSIPNYLTTKLTEVNEDDYPLNSNNTMFADKHNYDYLKTVSTRSIYALPESTIREVYISLFENHQYQSRLGNPWLTLCAIIRTLEILEITPLLFDDILRTLFMNGKGEPKFYYSNRRVIVNDNDIPSILPTLLYTFMNLTIAYITGVLSEIDYYFCLNTNFEFAEVSLFDSRLKVKSIARNYFQEAVSNLKKVDVPNWNVRLVAHSMKTIDVNETGMVVDEINKARTLRKEKLSQTLNAFIDKCLSLKSIDDIINSYNIIRYATNAGEYINTLTELSVDKAVRPTIKGKPVLRSYPKTQISASDSAELDKLSIDVTFLKEDEDDDSKSLSVNDWNVPYLMFKYYYEPRIEIASQYVTRIDFDEEWAKFMTVKSPGNIQDVEGLDLLSKQHYNFVTKTRIGYEMFTSEKYRDIKFTDIDILSKQKMNNRTQIDRRARAISGTSNIRMKNALPGYLIESFLYNYSTAAIQGKQKGDISDLRKMLRHTVADNVMISSSDISGMDTSIQSLFKEVITSFILKVLFEAGSTLSDNKQRYGPYVPRYVDLIDAETKVILKHCYLSAPFQAAVRDARLRMTSTTYDSVLFGELKTQEGTFGSGNPDTGSHHTLQLDSIYTAGDNKLKSLARIKSSISTSIMGDDIERVFMGRESIMQENAKTDLELLEKMGMKSDYNISKSTGVFLQQQVTCGRLVAYPDRISLTTKERGNENLNAEQKAKELLALVDDMSSRIPRSHNLHVLAFCLMGFTCRRRVMSVSPSDAKKLLSLMKTKHIDFKIYDGSESRDESKNESKNNDSRQKTRILCSVIRPLVWVFSHKGGNLPAFKFERNDGTFTAQERLTSVRGYVQRRLLYDISGCFTKNEISDELDYELLEQYGFVDTQLIIDVKLDSFFEEQQLDYDTKMFIDISANDFISKLDQRKYNRSRQAYKRLTESGIKIGRSQIYAYSLNTRSEQAITDKLITPFLTTDQLAAFIFKYTKLQSLGARILHYKKDYTLLYRFKRASNINVGYHRFSKAVDMCRIGPSMESYEPSWLLYKLLGPVDIITSEGRNILSVVAGKYRGFNYSDPVFKEGYAIYKNKSTRGLTDDYFDAVGIFDPNTRVNMIRVFEQVAQGLSFIVEFDTNPRRYFWNSTDIAETNVYLNNAPIVLVQGYDISRIFAQTSLFIQICANPYAFLNGPRCDIEYHKSLFQALFNKAQMYLANSSN